MRAEEENLQSFFQTLFAILENPTYLENVVMLFAIFLLVILLLVLLCEDMFVVTSCSSIQWRSQIWISLTNK